MKHPGDAPTLSRLGAALFAFCLSCLCAAPAFAAAPVLVEVRHAPPIAGTITGENRQPLPLARTPVTLTAKAPLTLSFRELDWGDAGPKPGKVTATHRLDAGGTHTFLHEQPFDVPVQAVCARPDSGPERCWLPQDDESDEGGRFIMAPGFVLMN